MGGLLARTSTNAKLIDGDEKFPKLHRAVCFGRLKKVKSLLEQGHDVNQCDEFGRTPLQEAAFGGRFECAKVLLEAGAHVRIGGRLEGQPIYIAATKGFVDIVKLLLDHGDDINENDSRDCSLLDHAVRSSKPEVVALLLKRGACVRLETIKTAITRRSVDIAILLIEATDNHEDSIRTESNQGTLLDCAVEFSQQEIVSLMLERGAHIQLETIKTVIRKGFVEMAIRLIEAAEHQRDSINAVQFGESLLDCALEYDQPEVVDVLLKKGAFIQLRTIKTAIRKGFADMTARFVGNTEHHADLRYPSDSMIAMSLFWCLRYGQPDILALLLEKGAKVEADTILEAIRHDSVGMLKTMLLLQPSSVKRFELKHIRFTRNSLPCWQLLLSAGFVFDITEFAKYAYRLEQGDLAWLKEDDEAFEQFVTEVENQSRPQSLMKLAQWSFYAACHDTPVSKVVEQLDFPKYIASLLLLEMA